ncbi:MAG: cytochrome c oxidase subunit II [Actinobacteria bacterium]|nr:cytochrome c oxidase subunit II [Actinomycetota bacterium]
MRGLTKKTLLSSGILASSLLAGCSNQEISGVGFSSDASSVNQHSHDLWQGAWIAAAIVGALTMALILWPAIFHRKKDDQFPKQTQYNVPAEIAYTVIPFIIIAVLFAFTARAESKIVKVSPPTSTNVHDITVNGIQWSWQFTYKEAGEKATVTGTPAQPPVLYMPLGEKVRFTITASDVVHGFWIPAFMIQIQNLPGVTNKLEFTANKLGEFPGRCNILCGRQHSQMLFTVKVVTPAEYDSYLQTLKAGATS